MPEFYAGYKMCKKVGDIRHARAVSCRDCWPSGTEQHGAACPCIACIEPNHRQD